METTERHVTRAAFLVMAAFALSRVLGLVRQAIFGHYFGLSLEMDAYVAAARIPEMLFMVISGGALGSAFIPLFSARLTHRDEAGAWRLASAIMTWLMVILIPVTALTTLAAPWLSVHLVAAGALPEMQSLTARLMQVMLLSVLFFSLSGVLMGALNAYQSFLIPALAPSVYNLALIAGAIWGGRSALGILAAAIMMDVGALAHLLLQVAALVRYRPAYRLTLAPDDAGVREVGYLMGPRVLGIAAVQLNFVITNNLAARLGEGAVSALNYAWNLVMLPQGILAQAVGVAVFPTFSEQAARRDLEGLRRTLNAMLRMILVLTLPATVGLMVLGRPIVTVLLQRGEFDAASTAAVTWSMALLALGLIGHAMIEILARAFYAQQDTWTPAWAAGIAVGINVLLGLTLPRVFTHVGLPAYGGLALANACAALVEMLVLLLRIESRVKGLDWLGLLSLTLRAGLASVAMGAALWLMRARLPGGAWLQTGAGLALGVASYGLFALLLDIKELRDVIRLLLRR